MVYSIYYLENYCEIKKINPLLRTTKSNLQSLSFVL